MASGASELTWMLDTVTVIGESAGGGGVTHQITAYGGQKAPFCKAIIQSPGYKAVDEPSQSEDTYKNFLQYLGVSSLDEARNASFNAVYAANANQVGDSPYGQFTFWPVVDGSFVPDIPGKLLATGRFDSSVTVMVGHNAQEGIGFTSPFVQDDAAFRQDIGSWMPPAKASVANLDYISNTLYPQIFDGSRGYTNQLDRAAAAISELLFTCHTFNLDVGFHNATYSYFFATPPAYHGQDVGYTFFTGATNSSNPDERLATTMQMYFVNLARSGDPNGSGLQRFEQFGSNANMLVFNSSGIHTMRDDTANERCRWWQTHL
jgi:carboxylesterase type B